MTAFGGPVSVGGVLWWLRQQDTEYLGRQLVAHLEEQAA